jgi:hypothetical protein
MMVQMFRRRRIYTASRLGVLLLLAGGLFSVMRAEQSTPQPATHEEAPPQATLETVFANRGKGVLAFQPLAFDVYAAADASADTLGKLSIEADKDSGGVIYRFVAAQKKAEGYSPAIVETGYDDRHLVVYHIISPQKTRQDPWIKIGFCATEEHVTTGSSGSCRKPLLYGWLQISTAFLRKNAALGTLKMHEAILTPERFDLEQNLRKAVSQKPFGDWTEEQKKTGFSNELQVCADCTGSA